MLLRAESPWGLMTWKSQLNLTRAGLGEWKWEKLDWGELKGNELWKLWFQITLITLLWNGDVTGEAWLGGQGSVCFKYGRYWSMFMCWWSWFRREREIDAEERGKLEANPWAGGRDRIRCTSGEGGPIRAWMLLLGQKGLGMSELQEGWYILW